MYDILVQSVFPNHLQAEKAMESASVRSADTVAEVALTVEDIFFLMRKNKVLIQLCHFMKKSDIAYAVRVQLHLPTLKNEMQVHICIYTDRALLSK